MKEHKCLDTELLLYNLNGDLTFRPRISLVIDDNKDKPIKFYHLSKVNSDNKYCRESEYIIKYCPFCGEKLE